MEDDLDAIEEKYARMVGQVCPRCNSVLRVTKKKIKMKKEYIMMDILRCGNCGYTEEE